MARICLFALLAALISLLVPASGGAQETASVSAKETAQSVCSTCHKMRNIKRSSGYSVEGWKELIATMIDLKGSAKEHMALLAYLAKTYTPHNKNAPKLVSGPVKVTFKEWTVPTLGQRSRDPIEAEDGTIWWAGQWGNLIGKIDPKTGAMKEYPLPAKSKPHMVTLDRAGNVWYTGNKNGTIGKFDPKTEKITVYKMPDPAAKDPHSAIFDAKGILWFTLQHSNMVGRLDPANGAIKLVTLPTEGSRPYGIKIDAAGVPWVACNGSNCLVRVDPATMKLTEVKLPIPDTTVRRLDIAPDGMIWYVNSSQGRLGRYDRNPAPSRNGLRPAGSARILTPSPSSTASSGTTNRASARVPWCGSIPRRKPSRVGQSRRAASMRASSATCGS